MRIGYSYWGFLGDIKLDEQGNELSTPDGNATYSWSIVWEAQRRGHTVYAMQEDRDYPAWRRMRGDLFSAFSAQKRCLAYENLRHTRGETFPELDLLLLEWRFPIPGRNCVVVPADPRYPDSCKEDNFGFAFDSMKNPQGWSQPDLFRQCMLLNHYKQRDTKIVIWDLDHKLTMADEDHWAPDAIVETSQTPRLLRKVRTKVEPPTVVADLLEKPTLHGDPSRKLVYIGSRYERDDVIDEWIGPVAKKHPNQVEFHGKWDAEAKARWPEVSFGPRCTTRDFRRIYGTAGGCPLLAKKSYLETGFITPRVWEALSFGTIPVGLGSHLGVNRYTPFVAHDPVDMVELAETLCGTDIFARDQARKDCVDMIDFMDARHFVDTLEKL